MRRMMGVALLALAVAGLVAGCGGDDKKTFDLGDGGKVTVSEDLPDDFPKDFPIYKGADFKGSVQGEQDGVKGFTASWETKDSLDKVKEFFDEEFSSGGWKETGTFSSGEMLTFTAEKNDVAIYVTITRQDDKTMILAFYGEGDAFAGGDGDGSGDAGDGTDETPDDASSGDDSTGDDAGSEPLPDEVDLPDDYPNERVPLPDGARVTSASSFSSAGMNTFSVEFYTKDSPETVSDYFKETLEAKGWENAFSGESGGEFTITVSSGEESVTVSIAESDTEGYTKATMIVFTKE